MNQDAATAAPSSDQAPSSGPTCSTGRTAGNAQARSPKERPGTSDSSLLSSTRSSSASIESVTASGGGRQRKLLGSLQPDPEDDASEASEDSSWDPDSAASDDDPAADPHADELSESDSGEEVPMDGRIILNDEELRERVVQLINEDACDDKCLEGKAAELQNVKMLLAMAQMGDLEAVELKFFVKGHTKNAVDRGFGHVRKKFAKEDVWTTAQLLEVVNSASVNSALVHIPRDNAIMKVFRAAGKKAYKDLKGLQSYQIFAMEESKPGVVSCRVGPSHTVVEQDLRRSYDGITTDATKLHELFQVHLDKLEPPTPNFEKKRQMYRKVRPYVPDEFRDDPIYDAPNEEEENSAKVAVQERRRAAAKKKKDAAEAKRAEVIPGPDETEHQMDVDTLSSDAKRNTQLRKRAKKDQ